MRKLDPTAAPVSTTLGVLGMPGTTAYVGLLEIGQPRPGETVVVTQRMPAAPASADATNRHDPTESHLFFGNKSELWA